MSRGDPGSANWYRWLNLLLDSIDSENMRECYTTAMRYHLAIAPLVDGSTRQDTVKTAIDMLRGVMQQHGLMEENKSSLTEVTGDEAEEYYAIHGRPGEKRWVNMMEQGNALFDKLDAQSESPDSQ